MTDLASEGAKLAAIAEVEKLLQRSEDLKRLPNLLSQHASKRLVRDSPSSGMEYYKMISAACSSPVHADAQDGGSAVCSI